MVELREATPALPMPEAEPMQAFRKTPGDRMFDLAVYGGLGYIANAAFSIALERYAVHLPGTTIHQFGQWSEKQFSRAMKLVMKDPQEIDYWAKKNNQIFFLGSGGWALLVPMKWLEDHKLPIIRQLDGMLGTSPQDEQEIHAQEIAYQNGPKQSVFSLLAGRAGSYAATVAFALPFVTKTTNTADRLALFLDRQVGTSLGHLSHPMILIGEKQVPTLLNSTSTEIILAGTSAGLHYVSSKWLAGVTHHPVIPPAIPPSQPDSRIRAPGLADTRINSEPYASLTR